MPLKGLLDIEEKDEGSLSTTQKHIIQLKGSDEEIFEVEEAIVLQFRTLKDFVATDALEGNDNSHAPCGAPIPLPKVASKTLAKVIEYCKYHFDSTQATPWKPVTSKEEIEAWDANFVETNLEVLYDLMLAANYLDIPDLMTLTSKSVYNLKANGRPPAEVYKTFHMQEELISMESKQIESGEDAWAFDNFDE